jgi:hypothetical protein
MTFFLALLGCFGAAVFSLTPLTRTTRHKATACGAFTRDRKTTRRPPPTGKFGLISRYATQVRDAFHDTADLVETRLPPQPVAIGRQLLAVALHMRLAPSWD